MEVSGRISTDNDARKTRLLCDPCKGENEDETAVSYCTVCNEYLCHGCTKAHARAKATKNHLLMDGDGMPNKKPTSGKESMCPKHSDRPIEFFCKSDGQFCCSVCALNDHKPCSIQHIDDISTGFHQSNEFVALEKASADLVRRLQETKDRATRNMKDVLTFHTNFILDLQQFRTEINNKLNLLEKATIKKVQVARDIDKRTVESIATKCDSMLCDIHSFLSKFEELKKYNQERQLVICCKRAADTVNTYTNRANELSMQNNVKEYKFEPYEKIRKFLDSLDSLGLMQEIKDDEETNGQTTCPDDSVKTSDQPTPSNVGNIDVRHYTDKKSCGITGGVMTDQTNLALVDCNNSSVKVADVDTNKLVSCINLPYLPWDITCVNRDQIVVTCPVGDKGKLVFLKVGKFLSVLKELDIGGSCQGIVYSNNTLIVSFNDQEAPVRIFDMNGKVLKTFKTNKAGDALFFNPRYISLSTDQQTVFVSDWSNNTVTSLTLDGTVQHVYMADSLVGAQGLAVDRNDNVYIAGYLSHNIHQLSTEGNRSQVILDKTHGVEGPQMVTYCKTRHRLYISVRKYGWLGVSVYQLHT